MRKNPARAAIISAAFTTCFLPAAANAHWQSGDVIVSAASAMEQWKEDTSASLNHALARASAARLMQPNSSIVQVVFSVDEDGAPVGITLLAGDGNWAANRSALHAVRQLDTLDQVPLADPGKARFLANFIFYRSLDARDRLVAELENRERARLASRGVERTFLAINN